MGIRWCKVQNRLKKWFVVSHENTWQMKLATDVPAPMWSQRSMNFLVVAETCQKAEQPRWESDQTNRRILKKRQKTSETWSIVYTLIADNMLLAYAKVCICFDFVACIHIWSYSLHTAAACYTWSLVDSGLLLLIKFSFTCTQNIFCSSFTPCSAAWPMIVSDGFDVLSGTISTITQPRPGATCSESTIRADSDDWACATVLSSGVANTSRLSSLESSPRSRSRSEPGHG